MPTPPGNLKYCRPSEIVTAQASWAAAAGTVSTDPLYGLSALYDGKMARPLKFLDDPITAIRVVGNFGGAQRVDGMALPNSNIPAGTVMRAEMNSTDSWVSPAVSVEVTMGAYGLDGHSASPWADFVSASGYSTLGYQYVSWYVPVVSVSPKLGELLVMARLREFSQWPQFDGNRGVSRPFLENLRTEYGVQRVFRRRVKQRVLNYTLKGNDQDYTDLQDLCDDSGGVAVPFFMVGDSNVKTDGGLYGRLTPETAGMLLGQEGWFDLNNLPINFIEDTRSVPL